MWRRGARVSWLSLKTKVDGLSVVWPQNHWGGFFGLASKPVVMISPVWPQNRDDGFLVVPQNQCGGGFPSLGLKIGSYGLLI
jgi:hypothetical protein